MKKLGRKLVLSSLSLGLAVVTLSTTTFAWYTNNALASVTGPNATTAAGTAKGLLISNSKTGTFASQATISSFTVDGKSMKPLQNITPDGGTYGLYNYAKEAAVVSANSGEYLQFSIFVKAASNANPTTSAVDVYLTNLKIENTTKADGTNLGLPAYDILANYTDGWQAFDNTTSTYKVDATQALNFAVASGVAGANPSTKIGTTALDYSGVWTASTNTALQNNNLGSAANAITYYNAVMATDLVETGKPTPTNLVAKSGETAVTNPIKVANITTTDVYEVVFTVWLDGWDQYCFDACQGQTFSISFDLTTEASAATIGSATAYSVTSLA